MASRYDTWQGTGPIQLPLEVYAKSAAVNEERTAQAVKEIGDTYSAYQSITPYGSNAKAAYTETMDKLKATVGDIAKMDLKTPDAKRKIQQAMSDRSIINPLKGVMKHSQDAIARKAEVDEYLKKNPEVNAVNYLEAFNKVGKQKGNAADFDPNEFSDLGVLREYFDVNKRMEEGIAKIEGDETLTKEIVGRYYIEEMRSGRGKEKIRAYVAKSLENDELVKGQVAQNLKYQYYQANPNNIRDGRTQYANALRGNLIKKSTEIAAQRDILKDKASKEKDPKKKLELNNDVLELSNILDDYGKRYTPNVLASDDAVGYVTILDSLTKGFDEFSKDKYHLKQTFNPEYLSNLAFGHQAELQRRSQAARRKELADAAEDNGGILPLTRMSTVQEADITPDGVNQYLEGAMPGVVVDSNGGFSKANFMSTNFNSNFYVNVQQREPGLGVPKDVVYNKADVVVPKTPEEAKQLEKQGYKKSSTNLIQDHRVDGDYFDPLANVQRLGRSFMNEMGRVTGMSNGDVYVKPGAKPISQKSMNGEVNYENAKRKIKTEYEAMSPTGATKNPFKTDTDYQAALNAVVETKRAFEKTYNQRFTIPGLSNSSDLKNTIAADIMNMPMVDERGKKITDRAEKLKIAEELNKNDKTSIGFGGYDRILNVPTYTFTTSTGTYSVPMHNELAQGFIGSATAVNMLVKNNYNPVAVNGDLYVNSVRIGADGKPNIAAFVIKNGGTEQYEKLAQTHYHNNQVALSNVIPGITVGTADRILAEGYQEAISNRNRVIANAQATGNPATLQAALQSPFYINAGTKQNPKMVPVTIPVVKKAGKYYAEHELPAIGGLNVPQTSPIDFETNTRMEVQKTLNIKNPRVTGYYFKTGGGSKILRADLEGDGFQNGGSRPNIPNIIDNDN